MAEQPVQEKVRFETLDLTFELRGPHKPAPAEVAVLIAAFFSRRPTDSPPPLLSGSTHKIYFAAPTGPAMPSVASAMGQGPGAITPGVSW